MPIVFNGEAYFFITKYFPYIGPHIGELSMLLHKNKDGIYELRVICEFTTK